MKLFLAEDKVPSSTMVLYGGNCAATAMRHGYERLPSWIGLQNQCSVGALPSKNHLPMLHRPHSIVGNTPGATRGNSPLHTPGSGHWSSQHGDVNVEETKIIMDVMQCQMEELEGECQTLRNRLVTVEDQLQSKVEEVSAMEAKVRTRRSASISEEPGAATTSQNLAIAMLAGEPSEDLERSPIMKNKRRRASSISNIQQSLLELRREYDNLQGVSGELRIEIQALNDSVMNKDRDISSKDQRISELEERNRRLLEDMDANSQLTSDLRVRFPL